MFGSKASLSHSWLSFVLKFDCFNELIIVMKFVIFTQNYYNTETKNKLLIKNKYAKTQK